MAASLSLQLLAAALQIGAEAVLQNASFVGLGGDSMTALRFSMECRRHKIFIPADAVLSCASIGQLLQQCRPLAEAATHLVADATSPVAHFLARSGKRSWEDSLDGLRSLASTASSNKRPKCLTPPETPMKPFDPSATTYRGLDLVSTEAEVLCHPSDATVHTMSETQVSLVHGSVESPSANIIYYGETHRPAAVPRLKAAWRQVCRAEPILGTTYSNPGDGRPVRPQLHWRELRTSNWAAYRDARRAASGPDMPWPDETDDAATAAVPVYFAVRFTELRYEAPTPADSQTTLIWAVHHALVDGWSAAFLVNKVHLAAAGEVVRPGPSFTDVCAAQQELRLSRKAEGDLFWAQQQAKLATARDELLLEKPTAGDYTSAAGPSVDDKDHIDIVLSPAEHAALKAAAQSCAVTTAAFFYAAWAMCLGLYTDSDNVVVGTVVSGRNIRLPGIFEAVGPMINMLPLQVDLRWDAPARDLVRDVFDRMQRLSQYSWTTPDNGFARTRGNLMAMTPDVQRWSDACGDSRVGPSFFKHTTNLPLSIVVQDDGASMVLQYSSRRFARAAMDTLATLLRSSLVSLCKTEATLDSADLVARTCMGTLATAGNLDSAATTTLSIKDDDLVTLFERAVSEHGSCHAIECGEDKMTYAELERLSGEIARTLVGLIEPEEVVTVHADGSINWIASIYGIIRAGGVYCPLDKAHPQHYRDSLFESSTARVFLATSAEGMSKRPATATFVLDVDAMLEARDTRSPPFSSCPLRARPQPRDPAYLCFTSGSTGKPKGVVCTHQGLVAFQSDLEVRLFASVGTKIAQTMSVAFDGAIHEVFSALSYGATLVLRQTAGKASLDHLKAADSAILTPSLASALDPSDFPRLKSVYLVGEMVPQTVCDTWGVGKDLYNSEYTIKLSVRLLFWPLLTPDFPVYGPTEATCGATIKRLRPGHPVTIGRPNPTTRIYILDDRRRLAPPGRVGEIYLAGVQVAQGYLGLPEITAERFLPDPFRGSGEFMYKTGDRGYWDEAGEIVFSGRADRQIKLRGFRVDLEDLEARILRACSEQHGARAVAITHKGDDLVCMIQSTSTDVSGMQNAIRKSLPAFAVPRYVSVAQRLPMTPNLKVDYRVIAAQAADDVPGEELCRKGKQETIDIVETKTEAVLASIWSELLDAAVTTAEIGPGSNFTQLGGHSLQQLRLAARLREIFGPHITMRMIADTLTLRDLATAIDQHPSSASPPPSRSSSIDSSYLDSELPHDEPWPMEREWWHKSQLDRSSPAFNVTWVARYDSKTICSSSMAAAWNTVLARHVVFRARYVQDHSRGLQRVLDPAAPRVAWRRRLDVRAELNRPFDLAAEAPVRVAMTHDTIVAVWSHIVCDYTALSTILKEVAAVYHGGAAAAAALPAPTPPCHRQEPADAQCLDFWTEYLGDAKLRRPAYLGSGAARTSYGGRSLTGRVSTPLWHRMQVRARESGVTLQQLLVAAVAAALSAEDDRLDMTIGTPFINRHSEADMKAVGLFLEPLPVRVNHHDEASPLGAYVAGVQGSSRRALAHAVPWHQLLEHLDVDARAELPNHPLFDCVASFHDPQGRRGSQQDSKGGNPWSSAAWSAGVEPQLVWSEGAKFKLMVECLAYDADTLLLRLEYDEQCFGGENDGRIAAVRRMILKAMDAIASREKCALGELRRELRAQWRAEKESCFRAESKAGMELLEDEGQGLFMKGFSELNDRSRTRVDELFRKRGIKGRGGLRRRGSERLW